MGDLSYAPATLLPKGTRYPLPRAGRHIMRPVLISDTKPLNAELNPICHLLVLLGKIIPITGLDRPRGFQEVKVPRFRDNGTGCW